MIQLHFDGSSRIFGGNPNKAETEEYDGTSWTESGDLNTARRALTGFGLQTAAIVVAGYNGAVKSNVEEYNGASWSEENNLGCLLPCTAIMLLSEVIFSATYQGLS